MRRNTDTKLKEGSSALSDITLKRHFFFKLVLEPAYTKL